MKLTVQHQSHQTSGSKVPHGISLPHVPVCGRRLAVYCLAVIILQMIEITNERAFVVAADELDFSGESFAALSPEEKELLHEFGRNIALVRQAYQNSTVRIRRERFESPYPPKNDLVDPYQEQLELRSTIELLHGNDTRFRIISTATKPDGEEHIEMLLVNDGEGWSLKKDSATAHWFVRQHGPRLAEENQRLQYWWACAAFSFSFRDVGNELLVDQQRSRLESVTESRDEHGHRIVAIRRQRVPMPQYADSRHGNSFPEEYRFYRDHFWVVHSIERHGNMTGTTHQCLTTQECEYQAFTSDLPRLRQVRYVTKYRDLSERMDELAWKPIGRQEMIYDDVSFRHPEESAFHIETLIDPARRLKRPGTDRLTWFLGINGLILLTLWYWLARRKNRHA